MHYTKKIMVSISIIISIYAGIYTFAIPSTQVEAVEAVADNSIEEITIRSKAEESATEVSFITEVFGTDTFILGNLEPGDILNRIFKFVFAITGTLAVLMLAVYGTQLIYGQLIGDVGKKKDLKGKVISVLVSLIILLLSYLILNTVNPDLVNFNLNFYKQGEVGIVIQGLKFYDSEEEAEAAAIKDCSSAGSDFRVDSTRKCTEEEKAKATNERICGKFSYRCVDKKGLYETERGAEHAGEAECRGERGEAFTIKPVDFPRTPGDVVVRYRYECKNNEADNEEGDQGIDGIYEKREEAIEAGEQKCGGGEGEAFEIIIKYTRVAPGGRAGSEVAIPAGFGFKCIGGEGEKYDTREEAERAGEQECGGKINDAFSIFKTTFTCAKNEIGGYESRDDAKRRARAVCGEGDQAFTIERKIETRAVAGPPGTSETTVRFEFFCSESVNTIRGWYLGNVGNTGGSFGYHVHLDAKKGDGESINPNKYVYLFKVGGRPLSSFKKSSVYGEIRPGHYENSSTVHGGVDYATQPGGLKIDDLPITVDSKVVEESYHSASGAGNFIRFRLEGVPGVIFRLLHLSKKTMIGELGRQKDIEVK